MLQLFGYLELSYENYIILSQLSSEISKVTTYYVFWTPISLLFSMLRLINL